MTFKVIGKSKPRYSLNTETTEPPQETLTKADQTSSICCMEPKIKSNMLAYEREAQRTMLAVRSHSLQTVSYKSLFA